MSGTRIRIKLGGKVQGQQQSGSKGTAEETAKSQENGQNPEGNNAATATATATATSQNTQNVTNNVLGMVSPGASPKLPSFKKTAKLKVKQPVAGSSSSASSSDASASTSNAVSKPVKPKKASGKAAIDWTSSSGDNDEQDAESAPNQATLSNGKDGHVRKPSASLKGKGKAKQTSSELPVTMHEDGQKNATSSQSVDATPLGSTSGSPAGSATPRNPAHTSHFAAGPSETTVFVLCDPPLRPPSPSDDDDEDEDMPDTMFDLEAQIQQAMQGEGSSTSTSSTAQPQPTSQATDSTSAAIPVQPSIQDSDDDDDDDDQPFDFNAHIAAALGGTAPTSPDTTIQDPDQTAFDPALLSLAPSLQHNTTTPFSSSTNSNNNMVLDLPRTNKANKDSDDDSDAGDEGDDLTFNLNAMLASAMAQATAEVSGPSPSSSSRLGGVNTASSANNTSFISMPEKSLSGGPGIASGSSGARTNGTDQNMEHDSEDEEDDDDDEEEDMFDLDAQLQAAMAGQQGEEPERDSDFSDEGDEEFDLDAEIGAAMGGVIDHTKEGAAVSKGGASGMGNDSGVTADDLQAMLKNAMHQAAMELEADEGEDKTADTLSGAHPLERSLRGRPFVIPPKPRYKPSVQDDGDPDNAFNRARPSHFQALPFAYSCSFQTCDRIFARPENLRAHQMTHFNKLPFQCARCPLAFLTNDEMRSHVRTHDLTRAWRYRCKGCHNLFGEKELFDKHASEAGEESKCRKAECEFEIRPPAPKFRRPPKPKPVIEASSGNEDINIDPSLAALDDSAPASTQGTPAPSSEPVPPPAPEPYFRTTHFNASRLLASTLVSQMASLLAQQYDRQNSLLGADDPRIDVNRALGQTIRRAGLTLRETAALATVLAEVASSRNTNLKISLDIARDVQADLVDKQASFQPYYNSGPIRGKNRKGSEAGRDKRAKAARAEELKNQQDQEQWQAKQAHKHILARGLPTKPSKSARNQNNSGASSPWADIPVPIMDEDAR